MLHHTIRVGRLTFCTRILKQHCSSSATNVKTDILAKALSYHSSLGWTDEAIVQSVRDLNINPVSHTIVGRGAVETVEYFLQLKQAHVMQKVKEFNDDMPPLPDPTKEDTMERQKKLLKCAFNAGLDFMEPYRVNWASALALLLAPAQAPRTLETLLTGAVDDLCAAADIRGARYDWYAERAAIAGLVGMTELHLVQDTSVDLEDTRYRICSM